MRPHAIVPARAIVLTAALAVVSVPVAAQELANTSAGSTRMPRPGRDAPHLRWDQPVICGFDGAGTPVRIQCSPKPDNPERQTCLVARDVLPDAASALRKTRMCTEYWEVGRLEQLQADNTELVSAIAEAPPGWARDELGRVMQITFDLLDRFYLGAGWLPTLDHDTGGQALDRTRFDMGFRASVHDPDERSRYDFRAVEGSVALGGLELEGELFGYDYSHDYRHPVLRITTFFGTPRRHDLGIDLGWGLSLLDVRAYPEWGVPVTQLDFGEIHMGWDLWQSSDLYNHLRLNIGPAFGALWQEGFGGGAVYFAPRAGLEGRFGLDQAGFHYLTADLRGALDYHVNGRASGTSRYEASGRLAYEVIFLAINDQPLTLRLEGGTDYFEGLDGVSRLATTFLTGLRFSLWAPPRLTPEQQRQTWEFY